MAGKITTNSVVLGDSLTDTQNFVLKTNADGTATLARGALGGLGTVFGVNGSGALTGATLVAPVLSGSLTGTYTLAGTPTITSPSISSAVMTTMASSVITSGTAVASTSGTSIDFTGIPSWVKRITFMFKGISTNGSGNYLVRLGTSSGIVTTGYLGAAAYAGATPSGANSTVGFLLNFGGASQTMHGSMIITLEDSATNAWVQQATLGDSSQAYVFFSGGSLALAAVLDRIRLTTVAGTDTFDAGSVNILYE